MEKDKGKQVEAVVETAPGAVVEPASAATKEYEITFGALTLLTDNRRLARAAKEIGVENGLVVTVNRTAKKEVKFAGL